MAHLVAPAKPDSPAPDACSIRRFVWLLGGAATRLGEREKHVEQMRVDRQRLTDALTIWTD